MASPKPAPLPTGEALKNLHPDVDDDGDLDVEHYPYPPWLAAIMDDDEDEEPAAKPRMVVRGRPQA